jgi:predicted glycosyltransferase
MKQFRALFFVFDGGVGIGHLRRLARIAQQMQGRFACLLVTGHRAAANFFIPPSSEYIHLPSWDNLIPEKSSYWGRAPFLNVDLVEAVKLRREIIHGVMRGFKPHAIFVDHLPLGANEELAPVIEHAPCRKYLVTRGVLNHSEDLTRLVLGGAANASLRDHYHRIFVAADERVVDFAGSYNVSDAIRAKTVAVGYVAEPVSADAIAAAREARGLGPSDVWVVASAGGGQTGEATVETSIALSRDHPQFAFDIVLGPRSNLRPDLATQKESGSGRVRICREVHDMALRHASADLVISSGGYNSMLEALQGRAIVLCVPLRKDTRDEQTRHAAQLSRFADIRIAPTASDLPSLFATAVQALPQKRVDRRAELDTNGAAAIERLVVHDLLSPTNRSQVDLAMDWSRYVSC